MIYENLNWCFIVDEKTGVVTQPKLPTPEPGSSFINCNLSQFEKTEIFNGIRGLKFLGRTNLINCALPKDAEVAWDCNVAEIEYEVFDVWF